MFLYVVFFLSQNICGGLNYQQKLAWLASKPKVYKYNAPKTDQI